LSDGDCEIEIEIDDEVGELDDVVRLFLQLIVPWVNLTVRSDGWMDGLVSQICQGVPWASMESQFSRSWVVEVGVTRNWGGGGQKDGTED